MPAQNFRSNTILVVDDDPQVRSIIRMALKDLATIVEAEAGHSALETYCKLKPHMVLLDIHLPGAEGLQLLQEIMAIDAQAYIYMISGDSVEDNVRNTFISGARGFITKPFEKQKLIDAVLACPGMRFRNRA